MVRKAKGQATADKTTGVVVKKQSKTGFSSMRPKQGTKERADAVGEREQLHSSDEIIVYLLNNDAIVQQLYRLLQPLVEELGIKTDAPVTTLQALVTAYTSGVRSPEADQQAGEVAALLQEVEKEGEAEPVAYLQKLVDRDKRYKEGLTRRFAGVEYEKLSWAELAKIRMPEAALERYRRAVDAVKTVSRLGARLHKPFAMRHQSTQFSNGMRWDPDGRNEIGGQQASKLDGIARIGLHACSGDQLHCLGMSNEHISNERLQLVVEEPGVGCRLQHNKI